MHIRFDGYEIGCTHDSEVFIADYSIGETEIQDGDTNALGRDGVIPGDDFLRSAQWVFNLTAHGQDGTKGVLAKLGPLERAWKAWANRTDGRVPLEYSTGHDGVWHRIYGRPRQYAPPKPDFLTDRGRGTAQIVFDQQDPQHYASSQSVTRVSVEPAVTGSGWRTPFRFPLTSTISGGPRAGVITNEGDMPAPARVVFHGPCSNPQVWSESGFEAGYRGSLAHDQTVTLDGYDMTAILRSSQRGPRHVAGKVSRNTRLAQLTAPVGVSNLWFQAEDPTGTSFVEVFWHDAFASMQ